MKIALDCLVEMLDMLSNGMAKRHVLAKPDKVVLTK